MTRRSIAPWVAQVAAVCVAVGVACLPGEGSAAETSEQAQTIVQTLLRCWQSNDYRTFASLLGEDALFAYPGGRLNKAQLLDL